MFHQKNVKIAKRSHALKGYPMMLEISVLLILSYNSNILNLQSKIS